MSKEKLLQDLKHISDSYFKKHDYISSGQINRAMDVINDFDGELPKENTVNDLPTEEQVLKVIFDCVFIRGIDLEDYKRNFTNEQSGLYDALVKLFKSNNQ